MSSYGKVDEREQLLLEARRRTRNRITIITVSLLILAGIITIAVVFGTTTHKNNKSDQPISDSVKAICDVTLHKDKCIVTVGSAPNATNLTPEELLKYAIEITIKEISKSLEDFKTHNICVELLDLSIDQLNNTLTSLNDDVLTPEIVNDLRTWLSAAETYQETCIESLEEENGLDLKSYGETKLKDSIEMTSNALAIITWLGKIADSIKLRRLLAFTDANADADFESQQQRLLQSTDLRIAKLRRLLAVTDANADADFESQRLLQSTDLRITDSIKLRRLLAVTDATADADFESQRWLQSTDLRITDSIKLRQILAVNANADTDFESQGQRLLQSTDLRIADFIKLRRLLAVTDANADADFESQRRRLLQSTDLRKLADIVVAKDGSGKYKTIKRALEDVKEKSSKKTIIYVKSGVYFENVKVEKKMWNVVMVGDGASKSIVSGKLNVVDGTPTFRTATFAVFGKGFMAKDMGFINTAGPSKHQAVALMVSADLAAFYRCTINAYQDSLYVHAQRQFYRNCTIIGTVDFIFGNSAAVLQNCRILPRKPMKGQQNTVTAQGRTDPNQNTGISIHRCKISPLGDLTGVKTFLGRPWKNFSTTVVMDSFLDRFIDPKGWLPWTGDSAPETIFYGEYKNFGMGGVTKNRVKWKGLRFLSKKEATRFTVKPFIAGDKWIPATKVPFRSGL